MEVMSLRRPACPLRQQLDLLGKVIQSDVSIVLGVGPQMPVQVRPGLRSALLWVQTRIARDRNYEYYCGPR